MGAVQLVDKAAGAPFSLDDVEIITLLAEVAGAAIEEVARGTTAPPAGPGELGAALELLAATNPSRYATVAAVVNDLLR